MSNPKISVIIPVYNSEKYLYRCLESILSQTLKDIEIICVDDGSTDKSKSILNNYAENDSRIVVLSQKNQGPAIARNNAIKIANGECVCFVDSDDELVFDALESLFNAHIKTNADVVVGKMNKIDNQSGEILLQNYGYNCEFCNNETLFNYKKISATIFQSISTEAHSKLYTKELLQNNSITFPDIKMGEDICFVFKALIKANNIFLLNKNIYTYYKFNSHSLTSKDSTSLDIIKAMNILKEILVKNNSFDELNRTYENAYLEHFWFNYHRVSLIYKFKLLKLLPKYFLKYENNYIYTEGLLYQVKKMIKKGPFKTCLGIIFKNIFSVRNENNMKITTFLGKEFKLAKEKYE